MKSIVLINPNLVVQRNDPFTTGIVYMPVGLAYVAASLRAAGFDVNVIDAFAERPRQAIREGNFTLMGLTTSEVLDRFPENTGLVFIFALNLTNHNATANILRSIKQHRPELQVVILENTQAVTAYALKNVMGEFFDLGADYVLTGEGEHRVVDFVQAFWEQDGHKILNQLDGLGSTAFFNPPKNTIQDLDNLSFPAWDLFPLENYWNLRFAHGPQRDNRYLPLLTSRGCPYPCRFCVVPSTNDQKWRARSAANVVDEIEFCVNSFGVREFHIEDLDPTISDKRIREIAEEILHRKLNITWKIVAGTKVETIRSEETVDLMAKSGCRYISISPETGSPRVLKLMRKPFDLGHAVRLVTRMNQVGIRSQACFVLGFPGETDDDLQMTWDMVHELTKQGVDEIALFIITPVPGSAIYDEFQGYASLSEMNFTPTWRSDYKTLSKFRLKLYAQFLWWKFRYYPGKIVRQSFNFLRRRFETKMEMVPYRALVLKWLDRSAVTQD
ncbi:MAG: B12-binding domain-containing radical SAM protein [Anaerolineales bacterium]|nr:B12-binding domain-containing radical SAM protein [Anaerolineales bacterium]